MIKSPSRRVKSKSSTDLSLSSSESYQSLSDLTIKCCICLEEVNNENSYMPECKHSWCKDCNKNLNKNNIDKCPICKSKFNSKLTFGKWKFIPNHFGGKWEWQKGEEDSKKKYKIKKFQEFILNILTPISYNNYTVGV